MERRAVARARTYLGGQVAFNVRFSTMDCLVRNLSAAGAKLDFNGAAIIPDEVDLTIAKRDETLRARIVWRRGDEAGVVFRQLQPGSDVVPLTVARRLRACEAEKAALQRRVAELSSGE
jgi:hypothetical protein